MRLDDSREAGLLNPGTQYSSLEMQMSEFDVPMSRRPKSRSRCYVVSACIVLVAIAAIVTVSVSVDGTRSGRGDGSESDETRKQDFEPAPSPETVIPAGGWTSSPPAPPVGGSLAPPSQSPSPALESPSPSLESPQSIAAPPSLESPPLPAFAPSPYFSAYPPIRFETICNTTIDPAVCLKVFAGNPNSNKVDLQQWTMMTMEAAEQALNESYVLALGLTDENPGNVALQQCIDVFSMALDEVTSSEYIVAEIDVHNPGPAATDAAMSLTAASTDHDTCQEGIDDAGPFKGSDQITGDRANHVDTLLSIALTFVDELSSGDSTHHRRLLSVESRLFPGKRLL